MSRKVFIFMGPQGSGKGTQAHRFARRHGYTVVSSGDLFRKEAQHDTERGQIIAEGVAHGDLIDDELTFEVVCAHLRTIPEDMPIVFEGFPRTLKQAHLLDGILEVTATISIELHADAAIRRIAGRVQCPEGHTYNTVTAPSKNPGVCDIDQLPLAPRPDDTEEAIRRRLSLYTSMTAALLDVYRERGILLNVNGDAPIDAVEEAINEVVEPYVS